MTESFPLAWPQHKTRTKFRETARFDVNFARARDELAAEMDRLRCTNAVLSTNVRLRLDGQPYANEPEPADPGVAVYFMWKGHQMCFACDRWNKVKDNIRAICKTIEAIRGIDRWGSGDMLAAAFSGFEALPAPKSWFEILEFPDNPHLAKTIQNANYQYKTLAHRHHPDKGGSEVKMAELNQAIMEARKELDH